VNSRNYRHSVSKVIAAEWSIRPPKFQRWKRECTNNTWNYIADHATHLLRHIISADVEGCCFDVFESFMGFDVLGVDAGLGAVVFSNPSTWEVFFFLAIAM
jgi:hypothetical protein